MTSKEEVRREVHIASSNTLVEHLEKITRQQKELWDSCREVEAECLQDILNIIQTELDTRSAAESLSGVVDEPINTTESSGYVAFSKLSPKKLGFNLPVLVSQRVYRHHITDAYCEYQLLVLLREAINSTKGTGAREVDFTYRTHDDEVHLTAAIRTENGVQILMIDYYGHPNYW